MATRLRGKPQPHIIVPDTSILFHNDKGPPVNPSFDKFFDEQVESEMPLRLAVPEVVKGELLFQQYTYALSQLEKVTKGLEGLRSVTCVPHTHKVTDEIVKKQVIEKWEKWLRKKGGTVLPIPSSIDWQRLCQDAIWRRAPFVYEAANAKTEKGFRDALILESLCDFVNTSDGQSHITFVCADVMLRNTAESRLAEKNFSAHDSLPSLSAFLKLTRDHHKTQFINAIQKRAAEKFHDPNDSDSFVYRHRADVQLREKFKDKFLPPDNTSFWHPVNEGQLWVAKPQYISTSGNTYLWKSTFTFVQLHTGANPTNASIPGVDINTLLGILSKMERLLVSTFDVMWTAKVKDDGRFSDLAIKELKFIGQTWDVPTDEQKTRYNIVPPPPPTLPSTSTAPSIPQG